MSQRGFISTGRNKGSISQIYRASTRSDEQAGANLLVKIAVPFLPLALNCPSCRAACLEARLSRRTAHSSRIVAEKLGLRGVRVCESARGYLYRRIWQLALWEPRVPETNLCALYREVSSHRRDFPEVT